MTRVNLSTKTGIRHYNVKPSNLRKSYVQVDTTTAGARSLRQSKQAPARFRGRYYVHKKKVRLVVIYGLAKVQGSSDYAIVEEMVFHVKASVPEDEIIASTLSGFEEAGYNLYRRGPQDRVDAFKVGMMGIDYTRGMDVLNRDEFEEALEARIAELKITEVKRLKK